MAEYIGKRFGYLTVVSFAGIHTSPGGTKRKMWKCRCDCGKEVVVAINNLKTGAQKSCGCWKRKHLIKMNTKHNGAVGGHEERLYQIWKGMNYRCGNSNDGHYAYYGGKGIIVCEEWRDYSRFREWAYNNGYDDSANFGECTLDRIDNNGNYEPSNCRWVDRITQANNTSRNRYVQFEGKTLTIAEFARVMNISKNQAWYYVNKFEHELKREKIHS